MALALMIGLVRCLIASYELAQMDFERNTYICCSGCICVSI